MTYSKPRLYTHTSRYKIYRQILDDENTYLETFNQFEIEESEKDIYHEVQNSEANRLDIISNKYYGSPDYYWAIALANNFIDPFCVKPGDIIRVPSFITLLKWKGPLYSRV